FSEACLPLAISNIQWIGCINLYPWSPVLPGESEESMAASWRIEATSARAPAKTRLPWRWCLSGETLVIELADHSRVLGWAPVGSGLRPATVILNHQIALDDRAAVDSPRARLSRQARLLGFQPRRTVAMMTGANIARGGLATMRRHGMVVSAWS